MRLLLHIGYHKAASTWLQHQVLVPEHGLHPVLARAASIAQLVTPHPLYWDAAPVRARLEQELADVPEGHAGVVSHERLSGNPHSGGYDSAEIARRLAEVTDGQAHVLVVLREQRAAIASAYRQYVRIGGTAPLARYVVPPVRGATRVPAFRFEHYTYTGLLDHYDRLFGRDRVHVIPFEVAVREPHDQLRAVLTQVGVAPSGPFATERHNVGSSWLATAVKRQANRFVVRDGVNPGAPVHVRGASQAMTKVLKRVLPRAGPLEAAAARRRTAELAALVGDRYAATNRDLQERLGTDLGALGWDVGQASSG